MRLLHASLIAALTVAGCADDAPPPAGNVSSSSGAPATCDPAADPIGVDPSADQSFPDVKLTDCGGSKITFDELRCQHQVTLLSIGAGWCLPCQEETPELEAAAQALADEGGGVVQVLFQDAAANAATTLFCDEWVEEYDLTIPVFIDPVGDSLEPFDVSDVQSSLPLNVIVDHEGKALFSLSGKITDVEATMRSYLPE